MRYHLKSTLIGFDKCFPDFLRGWKFGCVYKASLNTSDFFWSITFWTITFFVLILDPSKGFYLVPFILLKVTAMRAYHETEHVNVIGKVLKIIFIPKSSREREKKQYLIEVVIIKMLSIQMWIHFIKISNVKTLSAVSALINFLGISLICLQLL